MHTGLETEWFITLSRPIRIENEIKERMVNILAKNLDLLNNQMSVGQVKTIRTGDHLDYVEMLFSNELSAQLAPLEDGTIQFVVKDSEFKLPNMSCKMDKNTIHNLIVALKELYSGMKESEEVK